MCGYGVLECVHRCFDYGCAWRCSLHANSASDSRHTLSVVYKLAVFRPMTMCRSMYISMYMVYMDLYMDLYMDVCMNLEM